MPQYPLVARVCRGNSELPADITAPGLRLITFTCGTSSSLSSSSSLQHHHHHQRQSSNTSSCTTTTHTTPNREDLEQHTSSRGGGRGLGEQLGCISKAETRQCGFQSINQSIDDSLIQAINESIYKSLIIRLVTKSERDRDWL